MIETFTPRESLRIMKRKHLYDLRGYLTIEKMGPGLPVVATNPRANELTSAGKKSLVVALTGETTWAPYPYVLDGDCQMRVLSKASAERVGWKIVDNSFPQYAEDYRGAFRWTITAGVGTGDWDQIFIRDGTSEVVLTQFLAGYLDWGDKGVDDTWWVKYDFIAR